jgi:hypothetical protein
MTTHWTPFPQPTTNQPTNSHVCEFDEILKEFHEDFHGSGQIQQSMKSANRSTLFKRSQPTTYLALARLSGSVFSVD